MPRNVRNIVRHVRNVRHVLKVPTRITNAKTGLPRMKVTYHVQYPGEPVLAGNIVPGSQGRAERAERSERVEQCSERSWACSGHVAKISMLRLNIGSGNLSSCMLSIGRGPKAVQGKGGAAPLCLVRIWVRGQC